MRLQERPTWKMFVALLLVSTVLTILGIGALSGMKSMVSDMQSEQTDARTRGYINRSISCMILIVDNDRDFQLVPECTEKAIAVYYPEQVCAMLPVVVSGCGAKAS